MYVINSMFFERQKMSCVKGTTIQHLDVNKFMKIKVPVPSLEKQQKIVDILDRFSSLAESMEIGIPAEIKANRKRLEYYRDKIFEELKEIA